MLQIHQSVWTASSLVDSDLQRSIIFHNTPASVDCIMPACLTYTWPSLISQVLDSCTIQSVPIISYRLLAKLSHRVGISYGDWHTWILIFLVYNFLLRYPVFDGCKVQSRLQKTRLDPVSAQADSADDERRGIWCISKLNSRQNINVSLSSPLWPEDSIQLPMSLSIRTRTLRPLRIFQSVVCINQESDQRASYRHNVRIGKNDILILVE